MQVELQRNEHDLFKISQQSGKTKVKMFVEFDALTLLDELTEKAAPVLLLKKVFSELSQT